MNNGLNELCDQHKSINISIVQIGTSARYFDHLYKNYITHLINSYDYKILFKFLTTRLYWRTFRL